MQDCIYVERRKVNMDRLCYLFLIFLTGCLVGWIYEGECVMMVAMIDFFGRRCRGL